MDKDIAELVKSSDHKTLGAWAADVAERILPYFEKEAPFDKRPQEALSYVRNWVKSGTLKMQEVRNASLGAHAAARNAPDESPARFAARACGQAAAVAHVATHAMGPLYYLEKCLKAVGLKDTEIEKEKKWAHNHLLQLLKKT